MFVNFGADRLPVKSLLIEYRASFFAQISFFIRAFSAIGTASAIVLCPSVGPMRHFGGAPPLRTGEDSPRTRFVLQGNVSKAGSGAHLPGVQPQGVAHDGISVDHALLQARRRLA